MENNGFVEDGFIIDLGNSKDAAEIIYELSNILEMPAARNKKICLKLGNINLSQSQLLSIKSLISSMCSELAFIDTDSEQTELSALSLGIIISELTNEIEVEDVEIEDAQIKEFDVTPKDGLSYELIEQEPAEEEKVEVVEKSEETIKAEEKLEELINEENEHLDEAEVAKQELTKLPTLYLLSLIHISEPTRPY